MLRSCFGCLFAVLVLAPPTRSAAQTRIDFDDVVTAGCVYADAPELAGQYSGRGVTFSGNFTNIPYVVPSSCLTITGASAPNIVGLSNSGNFLRADFSAAVLTVSVAVGNYSRLETFTLTAFAADDTVLASTVVMPPFRRFARITVTAPGTAYVVLTATRSENAIDDFEFNDVAVCGNGAIEPGEECDEGPDNGPTMRCALDCTRNADAAMSADAAVFADAGRDAAVPRDATVAMDARALDAAPDLDAAIDPDAAAEADARMEPDAGPSTDAALDPDATSDLDGGGLDASVEPDAPPSLDASPALDASSDLDARPSDLTDARLDDAGRRVSDAASLDAESRVLDSSGPDAIVPRGPPPTFGGGGGCRCAAGRPDPSERPLALWLALLIAACITRPTRARAGGDRGRR